MNEDTTKNLSQNQGTSFEERVLAHLEAMQASLQNVETRVEDIDERVQRLETKAYDTKPIWENALQAIAETRVEMHEGFSEVNQELDKVRVEMREGFAKVAAEMRLMGRKIEIVSSKRWLNVEARVDELEARLPQPELAI